MEQSPAKGNGRSVSQEILRLVEPAGLLSCSYEPTIAVSSVSSVSSLYKHLQSRLRVAWEARVRVEEPRSSFQRDTDCEQSLRLNYVNSTK